MKYVWLIFPVLFTAAPAWAKRCSMERTYITRGNTLVETQFRTRCQGESAKTWTDTSTSHSEIIAQFERENGVGLVSCQGGGRFAMPNGDIATFQTCYFQD